MAVDERKASEYRLHQVDIRSIRQELIGLDKQVPLLDGSHVPYVNFDNAASTPTFRFIYDKIGEFLEYYSNVHRGTGFKSLLSSWAFEKSRELVAEFIDADLDRNVIIFTKNSTDALNKIARRYPFQEGDVVLTSLMEHHSNELPWRKRAVYDHVGLTADGSLDLEDLKAKLEHHEGRVRLVALSGASNVTGYINPIHEIARIAHTAGAEVLIDGAQITPHRPISLRGTGPADAIDYFVFSAHKMYAPFGVGVLVGNKRIFEFGAPTDVGGGVVDIVTLEDAYWTDLPEKEEAGTPDIVGVVALAEAIKMFRQLGWAAIVEHEAELTAHLLTRLKKIKKVQIYGDTDPSNSRNRLGVVSFNLEGIPHPLLAAVLNYEGGVGVRNGCFCAHTYVKCLLNMSRSQMAAAEEAMLRRDRSDIPGTVRVSFGIYNSLEEVDRLADLLERIAAHGYRGRYQLNKEKGDYTPVDYSVDFQKYFEL